MGRGAARRPSRALGPVGTQRRHGGVGGQDVAGVRHRRAPAPVGGPPTAGGAAASRRRGGEGATDAAPANRGTAPGGSVGVDSAARSRPVAAPTTALLAAFLTTAPGPAPRRQR